MNRRTFVETMGGVPMMAQARNPVEGRVPYYLVENFYLRHGTQLARINQFMSEGFLPAIAKLNNGPRIFLEAQVATHTPQFMTVTGLSSPDEAASLPARLLDDKSYRKAFAEWENGPEPPYEHYSKALLKIAEYCPAVESVQHRGKGRLFELRIYHSPTWKQLEALHQRFAGPEIAIFHRSGIHPILYTETALGANLPNLTYLIPWDSLAAREKAWNAFQADPEWVKVRKESIDRHGQIASVNLVSLYKSTPYSPIG